MNNIYIFLFLATTILVSANYPKYSYINSTEQEKEINEGQQLNVRFDSSNSFTHFSNKQLQKQSNLANGDASPVFLYPGS